MSELEAQLSKKDVMDLSIGGRVPFKRAEIESSILAVGPERKWVAITAYDRGGKPSGICDFQYFGDTKIAKLESPVIRKRPDLEVPALDLRIEADSDGIYVTEESRGSGVGTILLLTAIEIAKAYGAVRFIVMHGEKQSDWYKRLGAEEILGGFSFKIENPE